MASLGQIARQLRLRRADIDEWILVEEEVRRYRQDVGIRPTRSHAERRDVTVHGFRDTERGRGSASLSLASADGDLGVVIAGLIELAQASVGPSWKLPPPAAPARVEVSDSAIVNGPDTAVNAMAQTLGQSAPDGFAIARASVSAEIITRRVLTSHGLDSVYTSTQLAIDALLVDGDGATEPVTRSARRIRDVDVAALMAEAGRWAAMRRDASAVTSGIYDLVLPPQAMGQPDGGVLAPLIAQADGTLVRQGLSRYRVGQPVFATGAGRHISLASDGTVPFALMTAPFGARGEPVRRFDLIVDGIAAGVSYGLREAALAGVTPNGETRTVILASGEVPAPALLAPADRDLLHVHEVTFVDTDPASGQLTLGIGLATAITANGARPVTSAIATGNAFTWLSRAALSSERAHWGRYIGPSHLRINTVDLLGGRS